MPTASDLVYDHRTAERAFEQTRSARSAYLPAALPPLDVALGASFLLDHARRLREPELARTLARIPAELLEADPAARIEAAAWALWFAHTSWLAERSGKTDARVRASTLEAATEVKRRMMKVATFALDDHAAATAELASIASGSGHGDLASDLARLARVYDRHRVELESAGPRYRAADARRARELSATILAELGEGSADAETTWREETSRAFQLAEETWDRARKFLHAIDFEHGEERYPSVWSVRPTRAAKRAAAGPDDGGAPDDAEKTE
ncbi:hypothetical protein [Sandaracinus amylolyticus]|uniref:Uncharacterized protein n=1 Tax=Sandaracinus amylolyticus TaxID=927083 RepID=A0A0F6W7M7_9BACT|nr:hypothetical protein [Sandaracinus amylolyticus]AKF09498.1 hypothetical protein DB32_006647 [Sandaracinus amylolyticus]